MPKRPQSRTAAGQGEAAGAGSRVDKPEQLLDDAAKIRAAAQRQADRIKPKGRLGPAEPPPPPAAEEPLVPPEQAQMYGRRLVGLWNRVGMIRGWPLMPGPAMDPKTQQPKPPGDPDEWAREVGAPLARAVPEVLQGIEDRPWVQVAIICAEFILGALWIEGQRVGAYLRERQAGAGGRAPGSPGADRAGQDGPDARPDTTFTPGLAENLDRGQGR